jgi:hypothetical protein
MMARSANDAIVCPDTLDGNDTQHCAGALILREHTCEPSKPMQIMKALGFYNPELLDMDAPVHTSEQAFMRAHEGR